MHIETSDHDIARLLANLKMIDKANDELIKADVWQMKDKAKNLATETRSMLGNMVLTIHSLKNDIERLRVQQVKTLYEAK